MILAAEAEKEKQIREAEGEAEAIKNVQQATADGIRMVREAGADNAVLTLQAFEALKAVANGQATKLIIPSEIQGMAGLGGRQAIALPTSRFVELSEVCWTRCARNRTIRIRR